MSPRLTLCVFLSFISLVSEPAPRETPSVLKVQFSAEPSKYDPLMMEDGSALRLASNTIGTLTEYDSQGVLQNALLESVVPGAQYTEFKLKFRPDLKWSDGRRFHANQFLLALNRLSQSKVKVALSALFPVVNFKKTVVKNEREITVYLDGPDPLFLQWCALPPFAPIREDLIQNYETKNSPAVPTLAAYQVVEYQRDNFLRLEKNKNFYGHFNVQVEHVRILLSKDELNSYSLIKAGAVDVLTRVPVLQLGPIQKIAKVVQFPVAATTYLGLNVRSPPFSDPANRRLFRDTFYPKSQELVDILKTQELAPRAFLPPVLHEEQESPGVETLEPKEKVSQELKKNAQAVSIVIQSDSGSRNQTLLEFVQHLLKAAGLWNVNLDLLDWKMHLSRLKTASSVPAVYRLGWQNPVSSPYVFYQVLGSDNANNFTGWKSEEYDRLINELRVIPEDKKYKAERRRIILRLETILKEEVPVIPVLHQVLRFAYSKRVSGFRANPFGVILFREIRLDNL